ncbi:MAG: (2Fe-2S)-binding protein [Armatimonadetes bacterium CG_4_10_14_3_um_filter_66_18]|nr:(2Fe-2S)-binding protein [Armatimonadota bacterium]OIO99499.1 MAG: (2Fe-2S)-binding protein [Armatimonadetes bacterium CG2_30_66_41]PIU95527.1 MAG: (2Fe-2S)-binding protein [Armatimonadetes bacterium CG06_land_8_20_14_3_00_66_21]PIX46678.1 MAG: (2Fe-2S)-binding protein [Armatimonadetes bacterium CG_4_8_14_3_um_filter_66_20]PIY50037.1 MAG: (2Fe-2S)-binding protein [Armatimonadetes bacterium CG_4_10_14_3_um_filter_66_18]PIZ33736.1 MAG: (2Fe-2S)-binding protein [Armatimonadetes bacterium CG_4_
MQKTITLTVNGVEREAHVDVRDKLLKTLRDELGLTGTKEGCGEGECGSCTVLLDGRPVNSCLVLTVEATGAAITTIEGLEQDGQLHPLQQAFVDEGAIQCGFCTPGMVLSAKALLDRNPDPTEEDVRLGLSGNLCRCTGYTQIVRAVLNVAGECTATAAQPCCEQA